MPVYNDSPEAVLAASSALLQRSRELLQDQKAIDVIWNNLGFHGAVIRLLETGCQVPIGNPALAYVALILAAAEHAKAQKLLDSVCDEMEQA